ncbi:GNAT family N-acetyltransferase [Paracoccus ravus]|uniref:GNAT family N-acetyltransferase n=1 Tax=Paracoccus ravus TaxID=2447760 RepID=UPI0014304446|nr:GNAT family N-acetyltransferase [Paracoccus ravus]
MSAGITSFSHAMRDAGLRRLLDRDGDLTTCAKWAELWHQSFGQEDDLLVVGDEAALALTRERRMGARVLRSFTNGHSQRALAGRPGTDGAFSLLSALAARPGWEMLHLQGLSAEWRDDFVAAGAELGLSVACECQSPRWLARLGKEPQTYLASRSPSTFGRKAQLQRAFLKQCDAEFGAEDACSGLSEYLAAERASWKAQRGELLSATPRIERFYRLATQTDFGDGGRAWMVSVRDRGRMVAGMIWLRDGAQAVALKAFYDEDYRKYSLGFLLLRHAIAGLIDEGFSGRVDFYSGAAAYAPFATESRDYADLVIWARSPRARAARQIRDALHRGRLALRARGQGDGATLSRELRDRG